MSSTFGSNSTAPASTRTNGFRPTISDLEAEARGAEGAAWANLAQAEYSLKVACEGFGKAQELRRRIALMREHNRRCRRNHSSGAAAA